MTPISLGLPLTRPVPAGSEAKSREHRVRRFIPYLAHYDGETLLTEDDQLIHVIKLEGLAFQTRDEEELKRQKRFRNRLVRSIAKSDLGVTVHVVRRRHFEYPDGAFPNRFCTELDAAWRRKHEQAEQYVNEIYLSLVKFPYKAGVLVGAKDRISYLSHRRHREKRDYWRRRCAQELRDVTNRVLQSLAGYEPKLLGMYQKADGWYSRPLCFLNYLVNWENGEVRVPRMSIRDYIGRNRPIHWFTRVASLATLEGVVDLQNALKHFESKVCILDPSYLLLGGAVTTDSPGNMFAMGALLAAIGTACTNAGATPIVITHANGRVPVGKPMELQHVAWSGFQQWARQWWLLSRLEPYRDDGKHALCLRYGGSAGHTGLLAVGIDEGQFNDGGKKWDVRAADVREHRKAEQEAKAKEAQAELDKNAATVLRAMIAIIGDDVEVATQNAIQEHTDLKRPAIKAAVKKLVGDGAVVEALGVVKCGTGSRKFKGIRRPDSWKP